MSLLFLGELLSTLRNEAFQVAGVLPERAIQAQVLDASCQVFRQREQDGDFRLREGVRLCLKLLEHGAYKEFVEECISPTPEELGSDETLDQWLLRNVTTTQHISGTCKIGPDSDPMAVVDQYCRVRGLDGLRVVDVSVLPDCVRANTNATTIMIAERVSDWMKE